MSAASETAVPKSETPAPAAGAEALDIERVAILLGISKSSAKSMASDGRLPEPNLAIGKIRRWWRMEILAWLACQSPTRARWAGMRQTELRRFLEAAGAG